MIRVAAQLAGAGERSVGRRRRPRSDIEAGLFGEKRGLDLFAMTADRPVRPVGRADGEKAGEIGDDDVRRSGEHHAEEAGR